MHNDDNTSQISPETVLNQRKEANIDSSETQPFLSRTKQVNPVMLDSESIISPPIAENIREASPIRPQLMDSGDSVQNLRQPLSANRTLIVGTGFIALLCLVLLGALFFRQQETPVVSQEMSPDTPNVSSVEQPETTSGKDPEELPSNETKLKESSAVTAEKSPSAKLKPRDISNSAAPENSRQPVSTDTDTQAELNASLNEWINATNARNINQQMAYYAPKLNSFYRKRNASLSDVRNEKKRVFDNADKVAIETSKPQIVLNPDGRTATTLFRKKYAIKKGQQNHNGEVLQEVRWVKSNTGWRIVSERDLKVIN